jgi:putative SOS response-associated peptidase YedK
MCGRFVLETTPDQLVKSYQLTCVPDLVPRYNIAPSQQVAAIRQNSAHEHELVQLQWGLIPSWAKEAAIGYKMINARSETVHEKPSFRQALRSRRCIIPASGFYEWKKEAKDKIPHFIHLVDGDLMSLAGLWDRWKSPEGESIETCTILTTVANSLVKQIHDRMPVILHGEEFSRWLSRDISDVGRISELFYPYPSERLEAYTVSKEVNLASHNRPDLIQHV